MFKLNLLAVYYDAKCLYVERIFPEGKPICCCLCDVTIGTISNFRKHMKSKHAEIKLIESSKCCLCNQEFNEGRDAGIHLKRTHNVGSNSHYTHSPTPVMSFVDKT
jgi:hypothetical protein